MILYPALDVLDGRVVRLAKGDFETVTDYGDDPVAVAQQFRAAGADWLHLVDLSGARDGTRRQHDLINIVVDVGLKVQAGGGVRQVKDVISILDAGAQRVVTGSLAVSHPETVIGWLERFGPESITAAFDVRLDETGVAYPVLNGWTQKARITLSELLEAYSQAGLLHALVTDVDRDGMLEGPNQMLYADLIASRSQVHWQASGGVASLSDLAALRMAGLSGVIMGRALFEGRFTLKEALLC